MYKLLHKLPAETAHNLAIWALSNKLTPSYTPPAKEVKLFGLTFANPLGMAAGFDKNAKAIDGLLKLGFGFVEVGTVTPKPQKGNPKPRLFRLTQDGAIINRLGFNNLGIEEFLKNFARHKHQGIVGINIGANKDSADMMEDYMVLIEKTAPLADYITINISSPNTPGLRDLQKKEAVHVLLSKIKGIHESQKRKPPLLVKIAPDLEDDAVYAVAEVALQLGIDGIIATNTTIARPALKSENASQQGGLSGKPLTAKSTDIIKKIHSHTSGKLPIIGVGGVFNKQDYDDKIAAGASLVQVYTGLIYQGPNIIKNILG